jgi:hypothetical protein
MLKGIILCVWMGCTYSYGQSPIWVLPSNFLEIEEVGAIPIPLPTGPDSFFDYQGQPAEFASNAYHNPVTGKLLFFVVDGKVYDHEGYFIGEMIVASGNATATCTGSEEIAIFPDPGNCTRYYILSSTKIRSQATGTSIWGNMSTGTFSLLDLSLENELHYGRKGAMVNLINPQGGWGSANSLTTGQINETELFCHPILAQTKLAVSPLREDNSRLAFYSTSGRIHAFRIDETGISNWDGDEMLFNIEAPGVPPSQLVNDDETIRMRGEMELIRLSNGNYRIAVPYIHTGEIGVVQLNPSHNEGVPGDPDIVAVENQKIAIYLAELDSDGQHILFERRFLFDKDPDLGWIQSDFSKVPYIHGLEFSPNGNVLYVTHSRTQLYPNPIWFFDFNNPFFGLQNFTIDPEQTKDFARSHIEAANNGVLYLSTSNRLAAIQNPNQPSNPMWNNAFLTIASTPTHLGLYPAGTSNPNGLHPMLQLAYKSYSLPDQTDLDPNCIVGCFEGVCGNTTNDEACCMFFNRYDVYDDYYLNSSETWRRLEQPFRSNKW